MARGYGDGTYGSDLYGDSLTEEIEGIGSGNGGETFKLLLAPNGEEVVATLATDIGAGAGAIFELTDDDDLPTSGGFVVTIDDEVMQLRSFGGGLYGALRRGLSNTIATSHSAGTDATWTDTYLMAITTLVGMLAEFEDDVVYPGWVMDFDATQAYLAGDRYPFHVVELTGVFPPGGGASRLDGPQPSAIHVPAAVSEDCPSGLTIPARLAENIIAGDVALCRYTNPEAVILQLGARAVALQGWYGFGRRDETNADVTLTDPNGTVVDGAIDGEFFEEAFVTATLPGDDRTFTYGPPRFSNKGWPIAALAVRQGRHRVPLWASPTWHDFNYVYTGFHDDAVFVQVLVNRNGIVYGPVPSVDLPHPDDIDGPDATWDATAGYYTSTSWFVGIFAGTFLIAGPTLNLEGGGSTDPNVIPIVGGTGAGGVGGEGTPPDEDTEGGSGGDINPLVGVGVHLHTDLGDLPFSNPHLT